MKILSIPQTRAADQYTIEREGISSHELMERAARALFQWISNRYDTSHIIQVFCGKGNNGGDGLALARLLFKENYTLEVYYVDQSGSPDFNLNWQALPADIPKIQIETHNIKQHPKAIIVDALFGSGLSRPLDGKYREVIKSLNHLEGEKLAIDLPSGLFGDVIQSFEEDQVFKADYTLSFQYPKLALVHPYSAHLAGEVVIIKIGLSSEFLHSAESSNFWHTPEEIKAYLKPRVKHSYKGDYGKALILAGSKATMGAGLISAEAALRCGLGLLRVNIPLSGFSAFNSRLPEAMLEEREEGFQSSFEGYQAILAGPGLGQMPRESKLLEELIKSYSGPLVLDADGLNLLASNPDWYNQLGPRCLLTPHPGEFKRLIKVAELGPDQLELAAKFSREHQVYLLLKGSISVLIEPQGQKHFFDLGDSALAKGGSGDLLAGACVAFLAQGYPFREAIALAHLAQGRAANLARREMGHAQAVLSSDVLKNLGQAFN